MSSNPDNSPIRWQQRFADELGTIDVGRVMALPLFAAMDPTAFGPDQPLEGLIAHDMRIRRFRPGEVLIEEGSYGTSAFVVLEGRLRVGYGLPVVRPGRVMRRGSLRDALRATFARRRPPEWRPATGNRNPRDTALEAIPTIGDAALPASLMALERGDIVGEIGAITRGQRNATVVAETETEVVEMRWQALHELRLRDPALRERTDRLYRERGLVAQFSKLPILAHLDDAALRQLAEATLFETYGAVDWHLVERRLRDREGVERMAAEPVISRAGDQADGLILVRSGSVRVSEPYGDGERTVAYSGAGAVFGLAEIAHNAAHGVELPMQQSLRAVGHVDCLRLPSPLVETLVLPGLEPALVPAFHRVGGEPRGAEAIEPGLLEFIADERLVNGRAAMVIDLERCVRCDDCVRACATTHGGNPRFVREGPRWGRYQVAHACMHCTDPVCTNGCPTGAIARQSDGFVLIDESICIGCSTCANACPYGNIRMVAPTDDDGATIAGAGETPELLATKCDLCRTGLGGPACVRACPHDALTRIDMHDLVALANWIDR